MLLRFATLLFVLTLIHFSACQNKTDDIPLDFNSMQPFEGYPLLKSLEETKQLLADKCVDTIKFKKGEIIADIGAGNGYLEAILSIFHDSLTFYIQDIDSTVCNPEEFQKVRAHYESLRDRPFTNTFIVLNGTSENTNLPDDTFDKILMLWTYQYLTEPITFLSDVRDKLKSDGRLYVINPNINYKSEIVFDNDWNRSPVEKEISEIIESGFELVRVTRNYENEELPFLMIFRKSH